MCIVNCYVLITDTGMALRWHVPETKIDMGLAPKTLLELKGCLVGGVLEFVFHRIGGLEGTTRVI